MPRDRGMSPETTDEEGKHPASRHQTERCCLDPLGHRWVVVSTGLFSGMAPDGCVVQRTMPPGVSRPATSSERMRDPLRAASVRGRSS